MPQRRVTGSQWFRDDGEAILEAEISIGSWRKGGCCGGHNVTYKAAQVHFQIKSTWEIYVFFILLCCFVIFRVLSEWELGILLTVCWWMKKSKHFCLYILSFPRFTILISWPKWTSSHLKSSAFIKYKFLSEAPKYKFITPSILSDHLKLESNWTIHILS